MEVSMSKTRRGKYTDNRICYISKCKGDMRLYLRRKGKLPCFSYLVRGKSFSFYRGKIRVFCETTKFLVEFLIHGSILAIFGISSVFFLSHADFADIKKYTYPSLSVKISMHSCTFSKNLSILCLMLFL